MLYRLLLTLAVLLTACQPSPTEQPADEAPAETIDRADGVTIRLITHDSFDISTDVLDQFTEASGIDVRIVPLGDAGTVVNQAILTRDDPQGDVLFGIDNTFLSRALEAEIFVPYRSPRLDVVDPAFVLDPEHRVTPIDFGDVCLNYDIGWFDDAGIDPPGALEDLTDESYRGLLAVQNPATSSPGLAFLLATIERFGQDGFEQFWADLRANDVVVTDGWSQAYYEEFTWAGGGDRPIVVSYASSPPAEVYFADPPPATAPTGVVEASCFRQIEFAGILAGTPHEAEAQALIDFMLSPAFQEDVPLTMFVFPVAGDAELPDVFAEHAVVPDDPFQLDPGVIGEHRDVWIDAWTATVLR